MLVARNAEGELLKIPVPLHYAYVFIAGALIGMLTITGMAGSYARMLVKTQRFNQLRTEKEALKSQYSQLEQIAQQNELQTQSLSSLAGGDFFPFRLKTPPPLPEENPPAPTLLPFFAFKMTGPSSAAPVGVDTASVLGTR